MNDEPILVDEPGAHQGLGKARPAMREQILAGFLAGFLLQPGDL
jgi:hypothetical protein